MKFLRRITLISFIGLLLSFGLWWVSFWNFDYCLESPYRISVNHGSITWSDWSACELRSNRPKGLRKIGYNGLTTLWKPHFFRRSGNLVVATLPIWMAVAVFGLFYYGLSLVGVGVGLLRQRRGRCRECGRRLADTRLCCRACQTPVSMMTVGQRALGQFALHGLVMTVGAIVVSYFHFSATPSAGTSFALSRGALSIGWGSNARPGMSLAGYVGMKTVWLPKQTSSIVNAAPVPTPPQRVIQFNGSSTSLTLSPAMFPKSYTNTTDDELRELLKQYFAARRPPEGLALPTDDVPANLDGRLELSAQAIEELVSNRPALSQSSPVAPVPLIAAVVPARSFLFPLWVPLLVFGYATWRLRFAPANLLRRRRKLELCLRCGYDLRASEGRCPECGSEFESLGV